MAERRDPLVDALRHVYWVGGGSGAGKSTVARRLATRHSMALYATDDVMAEHAARSSPADAPLLSEFVSMSMDERWVDRSPETMLETFHWFRGEAFGLVLEDLLLLPRDRRVLVEGFRLLPELVGPLLGVRSQAVWLLPSPGLRRIAFDSGGIGREIASKTSDPDTALANLLERDGMFTERLRSQVRHMGLAFIEVDETVTVDALTAMVSASLGL